MLCTAQSILKYEKCKIFATTISGTDIVSVVNSVDNIEGSMKKLVDNKMINKIEKLLQEARTHVTVEDIDLHENM